MRVISGMLVGTLVAAHSGVTSAKDLPSLDNYFQNEALRPTIAPAGAPAFIEKPAAAPSGIPASRIISTIRPAPFGPDERIVLSFQVAGQEQ